MKRYDKAVTSIFALIGMSVLTLTLDGCGGSSTNSGTSVAATSQSSGTGAVATAVSTFQFQSSGSGSVAATQMEATPAFHIAPVILDGPGDQDAVDGSSSARLAPATNVIPSEFSGLSSKGLTLERLRAARKGNVDAAGTARPMSSSAVTTYTPAQIRSAYGIAAVPAVGATLTASQAAALGAGQTIYLIDAYADPNVAAELAAFSQKFGLPACSNLSISASTSLPLPTASTSGCQLAVVYASTAAEVSKTAPSYNSGWATEITLDVQWAHATAPLARLVLIEAPDASTSSLQAAVNLANAMGPGVVSMSFGAPEFSQSSSLDTSFSTPNMSYLAATGDSGTGVEWPSVSAKVLAVGGTTLSNISSTARQETAWSDTGGGISAYVATPSYQNSTIPGLGNPGHRAVADVSLNADPNYGQYLAVISQGSSAVTWLSAGGTSLATPQWAGILAIANAQRQLVKQGLLGDVHNALYSQIGASTTKYSNAFFDVKSGADGGCASCAARTGYDEPTGLGTPKVSALLTQLGGTTANPPVVTSAAISGVAGLALTFTANVSAPDSVTDALSGQPSGMTIDASGAVSWSKPVVGTYLVTITAKDSVTGLSGSAVYPVTITAAPAPAASGAGNSSLILYKGMSGKAGTTVTGTISINDPHVAWYSLSISGAPMGMTFGINGQSISASWPNAVRGSYTIVVTVSDSAGHNATLNIPVTVSS